MIVPPHLAQLAALGGYARAGGPSPAPCPLSGVWSDLVDKAIGKPQLVRLFDVFALGPVMILAGSRLPADQPVLKAVLVASGIGTIAYNGANYLRERDRAREAEKKTGGAL